MNYAVQSSAAARGDRVVNLTDEAARRVADAIERLEPEPLGQVNYEGIAHRALPLLGTLGEVWLLRPDGSLWRSDADSGLPFEPLPARLHTVAIVAGARRYPWLRHALPARPRAADDCAVCGGTGTLGAGNQALCHACGALGWVAQSSGR